MAKTYSFEALGLLGTTMDQSLLNLVSLAARTLKAPFGLISVLDERQARQYMSAGCGELFDDPNTHDISIDHSICTHVKAAGHAIAINDLLEDPRTRNNEVVLAKGLRSYIGSPIRALNGNIIGALCCLTDTPRDWTEDDMAILVSLAAAVDDIVKARGTALDERRLNTELQKLLARRNDYMASVGHEIRTPLTGMIASATLLKDMELDSRATKLVDILHRSSDRLLNFVTNVLDLSQIDVGTHSVTEEKIHLHSLVEDALAPLRSIANTKSIDLTIEDKLQGRAFTADRHALETILRHLLDNAIKFTDSGSVTVCLDEDSYGQVAIEVKDTGIGMDPESLTGIFEEFGRGGATIARDYGGHGLGLAIVKRTTDHLQGEITVESRPGQGSTIRVLLPLETVAPPLS